MIFKKHIAILLTFFLLVSNLGLAFSVHYCDEEIASITINKAPTFQEKIDECCGIVEKDIECCNDKVIKAEIKSDQIIVKSLLFDFDFIAITQYLGPPIFAQNNNLQQRDNRTYYCDANAPPLYLLYSQYTFYC
ncbi:MAG: hypothetical protein V4535_10960 [Bacteroidota bacterium]